MLKYILGIAGTIFQPPKILDQFCMNPMYTQIKRSLFTRFFDGRIHLLADFLDHVLDACRMNSSV